MESMTISRSSKRLPLWLLACVVCLLGNRGVFAQQVLLQQDGVIAVQATADATTAPASSVDTTEDRLPTPPREIIQQMNLARKLLEDERYSDAIRLLQNVLQRKTKVAPDEDRSAEDWFFRPQTSSAELRSLKAEVQQMLGRLPRKALEMYETQFGAEARHALEAARSTSDIERLAEVSWNYFHTAAGKEAAFLLGLHHFDRGRHMAAALVFHRLAQWPEAAEAFQPALGLLLARCYIDANLPDKAIPVLVELRQRYKGAPLEIGGKKVNWFRDDAQAVAWLEGLFGRGRPAEALSDDRWLLLGGDSTRNVATVGSAPLMNVRWQAFSEYPSVDRVVAQLQSVRSQAYDALLPSAHPIAVDGTIVARTWRGLIAVDAETGKLLWEIASEGPWNSLTASSAGDLRAIETLLRQQERPGEVRTRTFDGNTAGTLATALMRRVFGDLTAGVISSDGRLVYSIEDDGQSASEGTYPRRMVVINGQVVNASADVTNRLAAIDAATGKMVWQLGGPNDQFALPLAGTCFLGPPLPLMGQLFVLAERSGHNAVQLLAIDPDPRKGPGAERLLWRQTLAYPDRELLADRTRRTAGLSPSYADGILVCPTGVGAVVAVDLATRSLLWGYKYSRTDDPYRGDGLMLMAVQISAYPGRAPQQRWARTGVTIAEGRVLFTSPESDELHCVGLLDGKPQWTLLRYDDSPSRGAPRDDLYLACVYRGKAILVGRRDVHAVQLDKTYTERKKVMVRERRGMGVQVVEREKEFTRPEPAWDGKPVRLPDGSTPSGVGFRSANLYYLPLSTAEVAVIDLDAGKLVRVVKSRSGHVPGNLICHKGKVISHGPGGLAAFPRLDVLRAEVQQRLAANPQDPKALANMGEILLDEGNLQQAAEALERAWRADPSGRNRSLLRESLLGCLKADFAKYYQRAQQIESLLDDPKQRAAYWRLVADGFRTQGRWQEAFQQYLKFFQEDADLAQLEEISPTLSVRRDRWLGSQITGLREELKDPAAREQLDRTAAEIVQQALAARNVERLRGLMQCFAAHPEAPAWRRQTAQMLSAAGRLLEAEQILWEDLNCADPAVAAPAWATLAKVLESAGFHADAATCYGILAGRFASVVCLEGKTGKQLAEQLPPDSPVRRALLAQVAWPSGAVEVEINQSAAPRQQVSNQVLLRRARSDSPFLAEDSIWYDYGRQQLTAFDPWGTQKWQFSLAQATGAVRAVYYNPQLSQFAARGHLIMMVAANRVLALDSLGSTEAKPRLLWDIDANMARFGSPLGGVNPVDADAEVMFMNVASSLFDPMRSLGGFVGANDYVFFQRVRTLVAIDAVTGQTLWTSQQHNLSADCELFGDQQYVFAVPPNSQEAYVFSARDGRALGKRSVPRQKEEELVDATAVSVRGSSQLAPLSRACLATVGRSLLYWRVDREAGQRILELYDPWEQRYLLPAQRFALGSKATLVDDKAVGVLQPDGRFVLLSLPDGKTLVDARLPAHASVGTPRQLTVLRYEDGWLLVADSTSIPSSAQRKPIGPLSGIASVPMLRGVVQAFGRDGEPCWPEPVVIENQYFLSGQASRLPVLIFACLEHASRAPHASVSLLCLDKRTGRRVFPPENKEFSFAVTAHPPLFEYSADPATRSVRFRMQGGEVKLTFTDKPPPPAARQPADTPQAKKQSLLRALRNIAGKQAKDLVEGIERTIDPPWQVPLIDPADKENADEQDDDIPVIPLR